ncbi:hypothetical protein [Micromonospora inositola]|uniref:Uncharacterized protein n=1 Tax=Micromonospora inositola TaxID=47865 RepID=A0A1C5IL60_9ACTN|nr:hypothetical protein [Micromonospora inositola]SCG58873.1 hypothetical protein GA0070613_3018 [Micromonospora inositola]
MRQEEQQATNEHPEAIRSAPVPVPSPADGSGDDGARHDRADVTEDALDDRGTFDDPAVVDDRPDDRDETLTGDRRDAANLDETRPYDLRDARDAEGEAADTDRDGRPEFHEPAPLPTTFGATTVGDAVAASAMASGRPEDERDPRGEDTARPGDGAPGRTDAFDDERADPTAGDRLHDPDRWAAAQPGDRDDAVAAGAAGYGRAEPTMVDPDASTAAAGAGTAGAAAGAALAGAALAGAARPTPGAVPADAATLFEPETAQGFRDRWRDVQLRFVDDPRAAVGEAQSLVEEAIEALSTALRAQKTKLGGWQDSGSADTEQLRIAVRGYRDFLDRVLGR